MARAGTYIGYLRGSYGEIIDHLDIPEIQQRYLMVRWLDLVVWHDIKAARANSAYYALRITTLVGGATATAFASLKLSGAAAHWVSVLIFVLTLTTTVAAGLEELMRFGQQRARYRQTAERLKREGWSFFQLIGPYRAFPDHRSAFSLFSETVEAEAGEEFGRQQSAPRAAAASSAN